MNQTDRILAQERVGKIVVTIFMKKSRKGQYYPNIAIQKSWKRSYEKNWHRQQLVMTENEKMQLDLAFSKIDWDKVKREVIASSDAERKEEKKDDIKV